MYGPKHPERIKLNNQIKEWNTNRLDLFHITEPNECLEFYGVMRFFYQGDDLKYQTKCIRVSNTLTTIEVIEALIVKFHPDIKKLNKDKHALYENHGLEERKMKNQEHPLLVQLNWAVDDKDGKFILKNESRRRRSTDLTNHAMLSNYGMSQSTSTLTNGYDIHTLRTQSSAVYNNNNSNFFSRRFSNSKKSKRKTKDAAESAEYAKRLAEEISGKPPESSFTRTISNPDDVMKRRRQKKLEFRLEQFSGVKGDGEIGGTLKIYGNSINPDVPYKTLLLSVNDTVERVLSETLDKYGVPPEEHKSYVLVQQNNPPREDKNRSHAEEIVLHYRDCPLGILVHSPPKRGSATFAVRKASKFDKFPISARVPPFAMSKNLQPTHPNNHNKGLVNNNQRQVSQSSTSPEEYTETLTGMEFPRLRKLLIDADGSAYDGVDGIFSLSSLVNDAPRDKLSVDKYKLIKIGSQSSSVGPFPNILLSSKEYSDIRSVHCHITAKLDSQRNVLKLQLTPNPDTSSRNSRPCVLFVNQQRIDNSTPIVNGDIIQLGQSVIFRLEEFDDKTESTTERSANEVSQDRFEDSSESLNPSMFTADLPVTVKYKYKKSKKLVDRIMKYSEEYGEKGSKDLFSSSSSGNTDCENLEETFRLSPAYMLYLVMRAGLCEENLLGPLIDSVAESFLQLIEKDSTNVEKEIFWLSNASELLHLLQQDSNLRNYSGTAEDVLAGAIEKAFFCVQQQFSEDLMILLPALLSDDDSDMDDNTQDDNSPCLDRASVLTQQGSIVYPIQHLLQTLSLAFNLFHNCQVNVALTIQMFSQLFHLLNTWMFNSVLGEQLSGQEVYSVPMCQEWGSRLTRRLNRIRYWSEINGLELAANCHLQKMYQVAELMEADKIDLNTFGEKCIGMINLNGAQLHHLLINCQDYELPDAWVEVVVNTAIQLHDQDFNDNPDSNPIIQNKNTLSLYEDMDLRLPLLLPADGYCCDRGIVSCPTDLKALLNSLRDLLSYRLNPPTIDQFDIRWKSYLGSYETTPTVSRSNTLQEQTPSKLTTSEGLSLPRNWIDNTEHSEELSTTETISPRERFQKKTNNINIVSSQYSSSQSRQPSEKTLSNGNINNQKTESKDRFELKLTKINNSLGLSIIAAKASPNDIFRIYVKDIVAGGAGEKCGKISQGDQLVSIDGNLLEDMTQDEAVAFMKKTKTDVALVIQKAAAQRDGVFEAILQAKNSKTNSAAQKLLPISVNTKNVALKQPPSKPNLLPKDQNIKAEPLVQSKTNRSQLPAAPGQSSKSFQRPPNRKISNQETVVPEYSTLPLREHNTNLESSSETQIYGTIPKQSNPQMNYASGPSNDTKPSKSHSQPNLHNMIPRTAHRRDSSSSESGSSASMSSTDEEESQKSQPDTEKRNSAPIYERIPYPNEEKQMPSVPTKAVSDVNIPSANRGIPRHEVTSSAMELRSNLASKPLLSRPVLTQNSDPIISLSSQDESEPLSLNKPVSRDLSSTSESESESETMSSNTMSSSDPSPQPQKKLSSEPILSPRNNNAAIPSMTDIATVKSEQLPDRKVSPGITNLGGFKKPFKLTSKSNEQLSNLPEKESIISPKDATFSPTLRTNSKNKLTLNEKPTLAIKNEAPLPFMSLPVLPPPPSASSLQYQPPTDLTEINWNNNSDVSTPKPIMNDEDIKLKRKAIAESIRQETEERERKLQSIEIRPPVSHEGKKSNERVSTLYGRPQFRESNPPNRPYSLLVTEQAVLPNPNDSDSNFPSPPSSILCAGLVVPPSPIMKDKLSKTNLSNKNTNSVISTNQTGVEELSFRDKMKLFANKIGDENVVERHKVSSKQRRIDSGDFS